MTRCRRAWRTYTQHSTELADVTTSLYVYLCYSLSCWLEYFYSCRCELCYCWWLVNELPSVTDRKFNVQLYWFSASNDCLSCGGSLALFTDIGRPSRTVNSLKTVKATIGVAILVTLNSDLLKCFYRFMLNSYMRCVVFYFRPVLIKTAKSIIYFNKLVKST